MPINTSNFVKNLIAPGFHGFVPSEQKLRESLAWTRIPQIPVDKPTGSIMLEDRTSVQRTSDIQALVGKDGVPSDTEWKFTTDTFTTEEYGLRYVVTRKEKQNAAGIYDPMRRATSMLMLKVLRAVEAKFVTSAFATSIWTATGSDTALTGDNQWNSTVGGNPKGVVQGAKTAISGILDFEPEYVAFSGKPVEHVLQYHAAFTDVVGILNGQRMEPAQRPAIAAGLGLSDYAVSRLVQVTTNEGASSATTSAVVGDGFLVLALSEGNPLADGGPSAMGVFVNEQLRTRAFPHPEAEGSTIVEAKCDLTFKVFDAKLGYFVADPLA